MALTKAEIAEALFDQLLIGERRGVVVGGAAEPEERIEDSVRTE